VLAAVVLSLAILAVGIQWFASTTTPNLGDFNKEPMQQSGQSTTNGGSGTTSQNPPNGDFQMEKFDHVGRGGKEGHGGSSNPFLVVLNYFAIWAAVIIPTYYLEKRILRKRRKSNNLHPKVS
jgi:hypothetical protein